jgi:transcription initiation factor TFIIH subunit 2
MGSLTTTDPGNIHDTISQLVQDNIRGSVIALAAEVQVLRHLTTQTKGT